MLEVVRVMMRVKGGTFSILKRPLITSHHGTEAPYPLPNDNKEQHRLDQLQFLAKSVMGGNVYVPIAREPQNIGDPSEPRNC